MAYAKDTLLENVWFQTQARSVRLYAATWSFAQASNLKSMAATSTQTSPHLFKWEESKIFQYNTYSITHSAMHVQWPVIIVLACFLYNTNPS